MIGQERAISDIRKEWEDSRRGNRFVVLVGAEGSGKSLLSKEVSKGMIRVEVGKTVADIRKAVSLAYRVAEPTVYVIDKGDELSPASKNTLLKVTEEPPNKARFILETRQESSVLGTLLSRGKVVHLEPYTYDQKCAFVEQRFPDIHEDIHWVLTSVCETPGMMEKLCQYDVMAFYEFAENIILHITEVSDTNAFKSANKISFKEGEEGYDVELLFEMLKVVASQVLTQRKYTVLADHVNVLRCVSKYARLLKSTGINKKAVYDMFLLEVRGD